MSNSPVIGPVQHFPHRNKGLNNMHFYKCAPTYTLPCQAYSLLMLLDTCATSWMFNRSAWCCLFVVDRRCSTGWQLASQEPRRRRDRPYPDYGGEGGLWCSHDAARRILCKAGREPVGHPGSARDMLPKPGLGGLWQLFQVRCSHHFGIKLNMGKDVEHAEFFHIRDLMCNGVPSRA